MDEVRPSELRLAARVADALVYAAGLAGVIAGGVLFRNGELPFAVVAWMLTFVAGAALRLAAWASRAMAELLIRTARIEETLDLIRSAPPGPSPEDQRAPGRIPDPYRRWGHH